MPRLYLLLDEVDSPDTMQLDALVRGARSVRFTEVEVRRIPADGTDGPDSGVDKERPNPEIAKYPLLDSIEKLTESDGILVVAGEGVMRDGGRYLRLLEEAGELTDLVGAVVLPAGAPTEAGWPLAEAMTRRGVILISGSDDPERVGIRAARLAGWVRHAKGHEHGGGGHHHHHH